MKKIIRGSVLFLFILALTFSLIRICSKEEALDTYLVIGDYLSVSGYLNEEKIESFSSLLGEYFIDNDIVSKVNSNYAFSSVDSSLLLKMISEDSSSGKDDGLVGAIKDSKYITISVGMNDILEYIRFDSNNQKIVYDKEYIKRKLEIMKQNYYEIVEEIKSINGNASIYLLSYYSPFLWVEEECKDQVSEVFYMLNECVEDVVELTSVKYVDISAVGETRYMVNNKQIYLNQLGQEYVFKLVKDEIMNK